MKIIRTHWFQPPVKPVRVGHYERLYWSGGIFLDYWDGRKWTHLKGGKIMLFNSEKPWRGVAK